MVGTSVAGTNADAGALVVADRMSGRISLLSRALSEIAGSTRDALSHEIAVAALRGVDVSEVVGRG